MSPLILTAAQVTLQKHNLIIKIAEQKNPYRMNAITLDK